MAHRYDEYRGDAHRDDRGYSREPRRFINRAANEVRSWFGGHDTERTPYDEPEHYQQRHERMEAQRGRTPERWEGPGRWSGEHDYGYTGSSAAYGERWSRDDGGADVDDRWSPRRSSSLGPDDRWAGAPPTSSRTGGQDWRYGEHRPAGGGTPGDRPTSESRGYYEDDRGRVHQFAHRGGMNFAGRGPKGYQRSDQRILEDVCERLTEDWRIDASEMEVMVANGEVTLAGAANSRDEKRHVEDVVESISGVRDVHNNLRVSRWDQGGAPSAQASAGPNAR